MPESVEKMNELTIAQVFCDIQFSTKGFNQNIEFLLDYYNEVGLNVFTKLFTKSLLMVQLSAGSNTSNQYYNNIKSFILKYIEEHESYEREDDESFVCHFLELLIKYHDVDEDHLRFRVCEIIGEIFSTELPCLELITGEVLEEIKNAMLDRIKDSKQNIRQEAVKVLDYLQEPNNPTDPAISGLLYHMTQSNAKIRAAIVNSILPMPDIIPALISRCRDVEKTVCIAAFKKFTEIPPKQLSISQRHSVLNDAFSSDCEEVRTILKEKLLPAWLENYENSYHKLISALVLDSNPEEIKKTVELTKKVLFSLFSTQPILNVLSQINIVNRVIPVDELVWEKVIYWICLINYCKQNSEHEKYLEELLLETTEFCNYIMSYYHSTNKENMEAWEYDKFQMILLQLVTIARGCDISDECSRKYTMKTFISLLKEDISQDVIKEIYIYFNKMVPNKEKRINLIFEIVSDIRNPLIANNSLIEDEKKINELKSKLNELSETQRQVIKDENFEKAEKLKHDITAINNEIQEIETDMEKKLKEDQAVIKNDPKTILKCANIVIELFQSVVDVPNDLVRTYRNELLHDMEITIDPNVQVRVMECYALCCLFDKDSAKQCAMLFGSALMTFREKNSVYDENTFVVIIKAMVDLIILHESALFPDENSANNSDESGALDDLFNQVTFKDVIQVLVIMLDDESELIRETSTIGLMKMLSMNKLYLPMLVSKLILKLFNPCTKKDTSLYQHLSHFLVNFNTLSNSAEQLEGAFIPTIKKICNAPSSSPLHSISADKLTKFLAHITKSDHPSYENVHKNLTKDILKEIEKDLFDLKYNTVLAKTLLLLELNSVDSDFIEELMDSCSGLIVEFDAVSKSSTIIKHLEKFSDYLKYINSLIEPSTKKNDVKNETISEDEEDEDNKNEIEDEDSKNNDDQIKESTNTEIEALTKQIEKLSHEETINIDQ